MSDSTDKEFTGLRSFFWPIHRSELNKFMPMFLMIFLICFNYSILRNLKDAVVITASGAEVIPFIKVWVLLPMAVVLTVVFAKLSNRFSQEEVFRYMIGGFILFFAFFATVLYPLREVLQPRETTALLESWFPAGKWLFAMFRHWILTVFYVMSELWSTIVLQVLFWGFANEVTRIHEARRFYSVFSISGNLSAAAAGLCAVMFLSGGSIVDDPSLLKLTSEEAWERTFNILMWVIITSGVLTMFIFRWMNKNVLNDPCFREFHSKKMTLKLKSRVSLRDSFRYLKNSKYLICIAVLVVGYNLGINLVEVVWKDQLRQLYPEKSDYMSYLSYLTLSMGVVSTMTALFMSNLIARYGWTFTALLTPVVMLITSIGFFGFFFFRENLADIVIALTGTTPLAIAVFFGGAQNCLCKAAKYSVFDATKEMAYVPLDHESKLKGKAAIDGIGSRLGKSGGSLIHTGLLVLLDTLSRSAPYVAGILLFVIVFWFLATKSLGKQFNELVDNATPGSEPEHGQEVVSATPAAV